MHTMTTLLVSPNETRFLIHTDLLIHHSPFFRAALQSRFAEASTQTIKLVEETVGTFELFLAWLYSQSLDETHFFKDSKPAYYALLHLYSLADRLCVEKLRNAVVDIIARLADDTNSVLTPSDTHLLYESIRDSAPCRRLILDLFAFKKTDKLLAEHPDSWHPLFLRDLVVKLKRPDYVAVGRHDFTTWKPPAAGYAAKACNGCAKILASGPSGVLLGLAVTRQSGVVWLPITSSTTQQQMQQHSRSLDIGNLGLGLAHGGQQGLNVDLLINSTNNNGSANAFADLLNGNNNTGAAGAGIITHNGGGSGPLPSLSDISSPHSGSECRKCHKVYCSRCISVGKALCAFEEGKTMCAPWRSNEGVCTNYHEHGESEKTEGCLGKVLKTKNGNGDDSGNRGAGTSR
jgi:hypothetical protein